MEWQFVLLLMFGLLILLMAIGLPVAFAFITTNVVFAYFYLGGEVGWIQFVRSMVSSVGNFSLVPIPLFIFMGEVIFRSGLAARAITAIDIFLFGVPGRLAVAAIGAGTVFSTLSGSSLGTVAMLGTSLLPELQRRGYAHSMSAGPILATGGLAALIPPSGLAVILGSLAGISIADLLIAGIIPGFALAALFIAYVCGRAVLDPKSAPSTDERKPSMRERVMPFLRDVVPLGVIFAMVIGSLLTGWATVTESAAVGAGATVLLVLLYRRLDLPTLMRATHSTAMISVMIFMIIVGSATFAQILAMTGSSRGVLGFLVEMNLGPMGFMAIVLIVYILLGCFIDPIAILMLTIPFFVPVAQHLQIDMVWAGILMMIALELGFILPPVGESIFVLKGVAPPGTRMVDLTYSVIPFVLIQIGLMALLMAFPSIVTFLPQLI